MAWKPLSFLVSEVRAVLRATWVQVVSIKLHCNYVTNNKIPFHKYVSNIMQVLLHTSKSLPNIISKAHNNPIRQNYYSNLIIRNLKSKSHRSNKLSSPKFKLRTVWFKNPWSNHCILRLLRLAIQTHHKITLRSENVAQC